MAASMTSAAAPIGATSLSRPVSGFGSLIAAFAAWNDARMTRNALGRLSDRELDDIGLCRGDVEMMGR